MADNNYNMVKPVENLHNVAGLTPIAERKQGNRPKNQKDKNKQHEQMPEKPFDVKPENEAYGQQDDPNSIDYCA